MQLRSRTLSLLLVVGGLILVAVGLARRSSPKAWPDIGPDDPRVSGVFSTLRARGLRAALDSLDRVAAGDSSVLRGGHQLAHALGREAMTSSGDPSVLAECRQTLGSGCYHGVVEAFLAAHDRIDMPVLEQMCRAAGDTARPGQAYECMHGLGHGVLGALGLDYGAALRECNALSRTTDRSSCGEGVFMEAIDLAVARQQRWTSPSPATHHHGPHAGHEASAGALLTIDQSDPYSPCDAVSDPWATSCWLFQGFLLLRRTGFDASSALHDCDGAPDARVARCYESVGHQLTGLLQRDDAWIVGECSKGREALTSDCLAGASLAFNSIDWTGARTARFCAVVPDRWRESCYTAGAATLAYYASPSDLTRFQSSRPSSTPSAGR